MHDLHKSMSWVSGLGTLVGVMAVTISLKTCTPCRKAVQVPITSANLIKKRVLKLSRSEIVRCCCLLKHRHAKRARVIFLW